MIRVKRKSTNAQLFLSYHLILLSIMVWVDKTNWTHVPQFLSQGPCRTRQLCSSLVRSTILCLTKHAPLLWFFRSTIETIVLQFNIIWSRKLNSAPLFLYIFLVYFKNEIQNTKKLQTEFAFLKHEGINKINTYCAMQTICRTWPDITYTDQRGGCTGLSGYKRPKTVIFSEKYTFGEHMTHLNVEKFIYNTNNYCCFEREDAAK